MAWEDLIDPVEMSGMLPQLCRPHKQLEIEYTPGDGCRCLLGIRMLHYEIQDLFGANNAE